MFRHLAFFLVGWKEDLTILIGYHSLIGDGPKQGRQWQQWAFGGSGEALMGFRVLANQKAES